MDIFFSFLITVLYMAGGQIEKSIRRAGVPVAAYIYIINKESSEVKEKIRALRILILGAILSIGYGENSFLKKASFGLEWLTRLVYAFILAVFFSCIGGKFFLCLLILSVCFSIRAGKLFSIGKFDILIEDAARGLSIFLCTYLSIKGGG